MKDNEQLTEIISNIDLAIKEGRKQKLTTDGFALFMADIINTIKNYNYDCFYDIANILSLHQKYRGIYEKPIRDDFLLLVRDNGCDMIKEIDENRNIYEKRSADIYKLSFFWNVDYFYSTNNHFCTITKIK